MNDPGASGAPDTREAAATAEAERLAVLDRYGLMDTPADAALDAITALATRLLQVPVSAVSLLDAERQWFKSRHGLELEQLPRSQAPCEQVLRDGQPLIVPDTALDPRFRGNPLVTGELGIRFYAGVPLRVPEGAILGTLCVIDRVPRELDAAGLQLLHELAALAVRQLVLHRREHALQAAERELQRHRGFFEDGHTLNCVASADGRFVALNRRWTELLGHSVSAMLGEQLLGFVHPDDRDATAAAMAQLRGGVPVAGFRNRYRCAYGSHRWLEWDAHPTGRDDEAVFASARDVTQTVAAERALRLRDGILALINDAQTRFIADGADAAWWDFLLERLLQLTDSEYGFVGMTETDAGGPFLRTKSITNIAWDEHTRRFYDEHAPAGMVFRNMKTLFGHAMLTQQRYLANDVAHDPHAGGRPAGHPPLNAFAGLPIKDGEQMVGLVGLANRPGGYDEDLTRSLDPVLAFLGKVLNVLSLRAQQRSFVARLEASRELQERVLEASETGFVALTADGTVALANRRARELLEPLRDPHRAAHGPGSLTAALGALLAEPEACRWALSLVETPAQGVLGPRKVRLQGATDDDAGVELTVTRFRQEPDRPEGLLLALADLRQRAALEQSLRLNAGLEERVSQLRRQQRDNEILSECVEYLQRCATLDEGLELVWRALQRLFPGGNVALYTAREGGAPMALSREVQRFAGDELATELPAARCWALRTGRAYGAWPGGHHLACQHAPSAADRSPTYCVPLFTLEQNVALFSVALPEDEARSPDAAEARMAQFVAMAQSVSGALSTIALRESLQRLALMDELTQLPNRRAFELEVARNIAHHRRNRRAFALCVVDVDHFKSVNDRHGHDAGDRVLQHMAEVMKRSLREGDLVARLGGEEFAVFLSDLDTTVAGTRLRGLLQALRATPVLPDSPVTASAGYAHSGDFEADAGYATLIKAADVALYRAKAEGRDRGVRAVLPSP
ncbi:MAG: diguanylate cyclase domain-containing protein [Betaproteobacteria bacterium]